MRTIVLAGCLSVSLLLTAGCDSWKRADTRAGVLLAGGIDVTTVAGEERIRMRSKRAAVLIDPLGAGVTDYRLGRRPRTFFEPHPTDEDRVVMRQEELPREPNVLAPPGWITRADPPDDRLDRVRFWQSEAWRGHLVLVGDGSDGLRWRKAFDFDENSSVLDITVELRNIGLKHVEVGADSAIVTAGDLRREGDIQRSWSDGQWFSRALVRAPADAADFTFPARRLGPGDAIRWRERWWIERGDEGTPPIGEPTTRPSGAGD